jgi:hypothetical protein
MDMKKVQKLNPYANLQLAPAGRNANSSADTSSSNKSNEIQQGRVGRPRMPKTVRETAKAYPLYLHPAAHRALKIYAAESGRKMHDLMVEAVEQWFAKHGISQPVRAVVDEQAPTG